MTHRGTLAYYLAAWVIGCFAVAFFQWLGEALAGEFHTAAFLLTTYFLSLLAGAGAVLLFAFLLRRSMHFVGTHAPWAWIASGAILACAEISAFMRLQSALPSHQLGEMLSSLLSAANALSGRNFWQAPVDGAVTALVLCLVDRAFARAGDAAEPKHSPA